jgi:hypothetical protein
LLQPAPPQLSRFVPSHPDSSRSNRLTPQPTDSIHNHHEATGGSSSFPHAPLTRLATAATSNGLLTGQILFSLAFVGSCELPNWIGILW